MRMGALALRLGVLLCATTPVSADGPAELSEGFPETVITAEGEQACHRLGVWLALDNRQRARGLMHVTELPADRGMLFIYPGDRRVSMWMKNTLIPLDMVFIRADGTIANVARETEPHSLEPIYAAESVRAVLELNAGIAARLGLGPGRRVNIEQALDVMSD